MNIFNPSPEYVDYSIRLLIAALLSGIIGIEREFHGRAAGFRTNVLVGTGAALFMILSQVIATHGHFTATDPGRIAAQIITGIGFLGAGAIIKSGLSVKGLTTAASMWIVASIGMACGMSEYYLATLVTLITLICLFILSLFGRIIPSHSYRTLTIKTNINDDSNKIIDTIKRKVKIQTTDFEYNFNTAELIIKMDVRILRKGTTDKLFKELKKSLTQNSTKITFIKWFK